MYAPIVIPARFFLGFFPLSLHTLCQSFHRCYL